MSTRTIHPAPPFDVELAAVLAAIGDMLPSTLTPEMIGPMRNAPITAPVGELLAARGITEEIRTIPGPVGEPELTVSIFRKANSVAGGPGIYNIHGGGMIIGDRYVGIDVILEWVEKMDAVAVSVEYRLAPEHPDPALIDDVYAGLLWTSEHADELGFDPSRLLVVGASAGGGLAAGVTLMSRDRGGPAIAGSCLIYPMLDDRNETVSSHQIDGTGVWDRGSNDTGWDAYLGDRRKTDAVSIYAAPSRATDLSGLPPTYVDCGSSEVFRDEDVAYASQIWADGGRAELHVWPGGFHGFDMMAPQAAVSIAMMTARTNWVRRILGA